MRKKDHAYYLHQLGVDLWTSRQRKNNANQLSELANQVANCTKCPLYQSRTHTVFARGNPKAKLMIIGEAPGFNEDKQGLPFVGRAGLLLNQMLVSIGLTEQDIYIANVLKCRPPENRDPRPEEINHCSHYLRTQIELVQPKLLLALGRFAAQYLYGEPMALNKLRGSIHTFQHIPFIVSYHPAYLLRRPGDKKKSYLDLRIVKGLLSQDDQ